MEIHRSHPKTRSQINDCNVALTWGPEERENGGGQKQLGGEPWRVKGQKMAGRTGKRQGQQLLRDRSEGALLSPLRNQA